ncbi:hypothetical protein [Sorangium sp. So ce1335]|uniref:hypothetical protein n=1 Tax=Sorangium sp. So ce1335 TaxID=3133335 RepID=UPI003F609EE4
MCLALGVPSCIILAGLAGCASDDANTAPLAGDVTVQAQPAVSGEAITVVSHRDDSAAPVHVQIKECTTVASSNVHVGVDCRVDPEYALVGGGATTDSSSGSAAFLRESRPLDARTWRASSSARGMLNPHYLTVYAIGMRLDGVRTRDLQDAIQRRSVQLPTDVAAAQVDDGWMTIGGGAETAPDASVTGDAARFLTASYPAGLQGWEAASTDYAIPAAGTTSAWLLQIKDQVIEGFGGLEVKILQGSSEHAAHGYGTSSLEIEPGWALIGMGASIDYADEQRSRTLVSIQPGEDGRSVSVTSRDQFVASAGTTTAVAVVARKKPGTHGLCNPGTALESSVDSCVSAVCEARSACCTTAWDDTCVELVESVCGRSCAEHTCEPTVYEPEKWTYPDGSAVRSNCYYYAQNKYPVSGAGIAPGYTMGVSPVGGQDNMIEEYAAGDGLIPSSLEEPCPDNRTKIFLTANWGSYHVYRQDADGTWSDKFSVDGLALPTPDTGRRPQHVADPRNSVEVYMCACNQRLPDQLPPKP